MLFNEKAFSARKKFRAHYLRPVLQEKWAKNYIFLLLVINNKLTLNSVWLKKRKILDYLLLETKIKIFFKSKVVPSKS